LSGWFVSVALVAAVSGVLELLEGDPSASTVAALYLFAVLPVAIVWGAWFGVVVAVASTAAYDFLFVPARYSIDVADPRNWLRLAAFVAAAGVVSQLAERWRGSARLAAEQAAVRRVATLVARGAPPDELFAGVVEEVGRVLPVEFVAMGRYESDGTMTTVATSVGVAARGRGLRSSVGSPIVVEGRVWGVMTASSRPEQPLPVDTEARLASFTELVATAISNTDARMEAARLAEEQAALRRVATLVARESAPAEVFAAVAEEVGRLLRVEATTILRYEPDGTATLVAHRGEPVARFPVGTNVTFERENVEGNVVALVLDTGRAVRIDDFAKAPGAAAAHARTLGVRSAVATPIVVEGRLWGAVCALSRRAEPLPADTEVRIGEFTELVATAIANIQARSELAASRARVVAAADAERRRVARDLHDGAQQRLVHTVITLTLAREALQNGEDDVPALVTEALDNAQQATDELRELAHGILPAVLTHGGLRAAVEALASRMPVPVENGVAVGRLPATLEATAYFVVAEALTNVAKHARAAYAEVTARIEHGTLAVQVRDDGVGGARPDGSGLVGLADRLAALDGRLRVESPVDGGTLIAAAIPIAGQLQQLRS
jgi:signal transduction histidine kinase